MNAHPRVWLKTREQKLLALLEDEAKGAAILEELNATLRQLRAKSSFRLALLNSLIESIKEDNK